MAKVLVGNFKGPKGDTGKTGPAGPQGPQGPQGNPGTVNIADDSRPKTLHTHYLHQRVKNYTIIYCRSAIPIC